VTELLRQRLTDLLNRLAHSGALDVYDDLTVEDFYSFYESFPPWEEAASLCEELPLSSERLRTFDADLRELLDDDERLEGNPSRQDVETLLEKYELSPPSTDNRASDVRRLRRHFRFRASSILRDSRDYARDLLKTTDGSNEAIDSSEQLTNLNECEAAIVQALKEENGSLRGEALAKKAGYKYNGHFKGTLSSLVKQGILTNNRSSGGYSLLTDQISQD
jgi:hypothetical protein